MTHLNAKAPHLKNMASLDTLLLRELGAVLLFALTACFYHGAPFVLLLGMAVLVTVATEWFFRFLGLSKSLPVDLALYQQVLLLILFIPENVPAGAAFLSLMALILAYRAAGGVSGYVIQPGCLALALLYGLGVKPQFCLEGISGLTGTILIFIWCVIRYPRSPIQIQRLALIAGAAFFLCVLHGKPFIPAVIWSLAAGDLIFDRALAPLSKKGRLIYGLGALALFALIVAASDGMDALIFTGLIAGFFSAWVEERGLTGRVYGSI